MKKVLSPGDTKYLFIGTLMFNSFFLQPIFKKEGEWRKLWTFDLICKSVGWVWGAPGSVLTNKQESTDIYCIVKCNKKNTWTDFSMLNLLKWAYILCKSCYCVICHGSLIPFHLGKKNSDCIRPSIHFYLRGVRQWLCELIPAFDGLHWLQSLGNPFHSQEISPQPEQ